MMSRRRITRLLIGLLILGGTRESLRGQARAEDPPVGLPPEVQTLVFAVRPVLGEHWYANFGYYAEDTRRKLYREGGGLYLLDVRSGRRTPLLEDARGGVRDPQVHYDGRTILFAYRKGGTEYYHLYEIRSDRTGLRQLTDGPCDDLEPSYLPDDGIAFVSSRCNRWVNCWLTQVAVVYRCDRNGNDIHPISSNNEQDNTPWPLSDGRILYTRWEYVDRSQVDFHHLWAANPDGTGQTIYYGNLHPGTVMIDAKPIPGTGKVVASFSPGHGQTEHEGAITIVDPRGGPDATAFARRISPTADLRDPWAFSEECFMAARGPALVVMDGAGRTRDIYQLPADESRAGLQCHEPRPLYRRSRERVIASRRRSGPSTGVYVLADVTQGRNMAGVKRGEIRKLLVLETLPKPINYTGGMEPMSYGGTFTLERILGTVPVEPDGSAHFEVPALRSLFFVALDEDDLSVKRMQSFTTVQPGETLGCVGCHEARARTLASGSHVPMAVRRPPDAITPIDDVPDVLDFPRDIQPILDRHCLACHDYDRREDGVILSGDRGPAYSHSYFALTARSQIADGRNLYVSNYPPRALGSSASGLMSKLGPSHHGVRVSLLERKTIRLWIETGAPYPGTYAALGSGMIGEYAQNRIIRPDLDWPSTHAASEAIRRRCGFCHTGGRSLPLTVSDEITGPPWQFMGPRDARRHFSRHLLYNLTRPDQSLILLAPLSRDEGGYEACRRDEEVARVFETTGDPDYQAILAAVRDAGRYLDRIRRFDMPGFHPRSEWVREMKRFSILPAAASASDPIDVYDVEGRYWESLWYHPPAEGTD
jgi:hypothetical protein